MKEEEREKIRKNFVLLTESLGNLSDLIPYMVEKGLLEDKQVELLNAKQSSQDKATDLLLGITRRSPSSKCDDPYKAFIIGLNMFGFEDLAKTLDQTDVSLICNENMDARLLPTKIQRMSESNKLKLQSCHSYLCQNIIIDGQLVEYLFQQFLLDYNDMERLGVKISPTDKINKLLNIIHSKKYFVCNGDPFDVFMKCLAETDQKHIIYELQKCVKTNAQGK